VKNLAHSFFYQYRFILFAHFISLKFEREK